MFSPNAKARKGDPLMRPNTECPQISRTTPCQHLFSPPPKGPAMGRPIGSKNERKPSGDLGAAGFDFIGSLVDLLDAKAADDVASGDRARLAAMMRMLPTMYPPQKPIAPAGDLRPPLLPH